MARIFRKTSSIKPPQRDREAQHEEYWREHKHATKCPRCGNVHFKKRWYSSWFDLKKRLKDKMPGISETKLCPVCKMILGRLFEGEIFIKGFPEKYNKELLRLIHNFGERATEKDPQDRIIDIKKTDKGYRVTTTENQLADKLAKKIKDVFNTVDIHFSHAAEPEEVDRVHVTFIS